MRQLDLIVEQLNAAKTSLKTDWRKLPNGQQAKAWTRYPDRRLPGRRRWLYQGTPRDPGGIDPVLYGTDLSENNVLQWHAYVARAALALKNNRGKTSPQRHDYEQQFDFWRTYLLDDFEGLWGDRINFNFDRSLYRSVMGHLAYCRAMYLLEGRARDNSSVVTLNGWRQGDDVVITHEGVQLRAVPQGSKAGSANAGQSFSTTGWQPVFVSHHTMGHAYHLYLMGTLNQAYVTELANGLYYSTLIDGPKGELATDLGGGGIPYGGAPRDRLLTRDGGQYNAKYLLSSKVKGRYSARESLSDGLWLPVHFGSAAFISDLTTLRNRFSPLSSSNTPLDKAALCLARLRQAGFQRNDDLPTGPGSGGSPQNPEPPPYYAPTEPPDLRRYFFFEEADVAERIPDFTLLPDRVDFDPGDPLQPPEASLPADIINELIRYTRLQTSAINQLIDERNNGVPSGGGGGTGGDAGGGVTGGGEFTAWPDALARYICWGQSGQPTEIESGGGTTAKLRLIGGAAINENGVVCRRATSGNPQYAMSESLGFDLIGDYAALAVVKDVAGAGDLAAYVSIALPGLNDGYLQAQQLGGNLQGVYRTVDSDIWAKTLDTPAQPLPFGGDGWRVTKIAKIGDNFAVTNVNRLALGDTPNKARLSFASGTGGKFHNTVGDRFRIGSGIVPRVQPGTGLIGMGNFTLGALVLVAGAMTDDETVIWYNAFRNAQIAAGLSTVLTAPVA